MKRHQKAAPITITDSDIACWRFPPRNVNLSGHLWLLSREEDRRDAELMFRCQQARHRMFPVDMPPLRIRAGADRVLECGGALFLPANREAG